MRCIVCNSFAPPEALTIEQKDEDPLGAGSLRVQVTACGVNFVDGLFVQGLYQIKPPTPFVPGSEIAGVVTEIGPDATGFHVGDRVLASVGLGGFADEVVLRPGQATLIPDGVTDAQAATLTQSYCTGWFALVERAGLAEARRAGQWLLVLGAGGGVGLAACDIGRALGLRVIAAASSASKRAAALAAGAEFAIDSSTEDVKERAKEISGGGVDVIFDPVGGELAERCLRALRFDGQLLVIGFASGDIPRLPANQILLRNRRVVGVDWGMWAMERPAEQRRLFSDVLTAITDGRLHPAEPTTYPFDQVAIALRDLLERRAAGKVALIP